MTTIRVTNWGKWQSYRRDRGAPPWIKVYRNLMSNAEWVSLTDAEKGQLVSIWLVAADKGGEVPADPAILRKVCQLDERPNINKFIELGFMSPNGCQDAAKLTTERRQVDAPETETETETERKREGALTQTVAVAKSADPTPDLPPIPESLKRGTRLSLESLPNDWRGFCQAERPDLDPERMWAIFQDHWRAKAGKDGAKLDWPATWRNWVRREGKGNGLNRQADGSGGRATKDERGKAALLRGLDADLPEPPQ